MMPEDKAEITAKRYELLDRVIELLSHGEAVIKWADKTIVCVEEIDAKESKVTKMI